jgi:alpha-tubulin suppressor-like RCC1 family protein
MTDITITNAAVVGRTVVLTVDSGIAEGDTVTVDYDATTLAGLAGDTYRCPVAAFSEEVVNGYIAPIIIEIFTTGWDHNWVLKDSILYGMGTNARGNIGLGGEATPPNPVMEPTIVDFTSLDGNVIKVTSNTQQWGTAFLTDTGAVYLAGLASVTWPGEPPTYEIGFYDCHTSPVNYLTNSGFVDIAATQNTYFGLKADGSLWGFGYDTYGLFGYDSSGGATQQNVPIAVYPELSFVGMKCGYYGILAMDTTGELWVWGGNYAYDRATTGRVSLGTDAVDYEISDYTIHILRDDGTIDCHGGDWGQGNFGAGPGVDEFLDGAFIKSTQPVGKTFVQIATGSYSLFALTSTGEVYATGSNYYNNLGVEPFDYVDIMTLQPVIGGHTFTDIYSNYTYHTFAVKADGSIWGWGFGNYGQLGLDQGLVSWSEFSQPYQLDI